MKRRQPRCSRLMLPVAPVLAALTMLTGTAEAGPSCSEGTICFWAGPDFSGEKTVILDPQPGCVSLSPAAASVVNATGGSVQLFSGSDCSGEMGTLGPGESAPSISAGSYAVA